MAKSTMKFDVETRKTETISFKSFGSHMTSVFQAIMELVRNSIDAVMENDVNNRKIDIRFQDDYFIIQDNGYGMTVDEMFGALNYSVSSHRGKNNNMGEGLQMALAKANENNDDWVIYSRNKQLKKEGISYISAKAPYAEINSVTKFYDAPWPDEFADWANTVIKVKVQNCDMTCNEIFSKLELYTTMATSEEVFNIKIRFNNVLLRPVVPSLIRTVTSTVFEFAGTKNKIVAYNFVLEDDANEPFWTPETAKEGTWLFIDGTLYEYIGTRCIASKSRRNIDKSFAPLKAHPTLNRFVSFVHVQHESSLPELRLPVEATKTSINFDASEFGKALRESINSLIGEWFREGKKDDEEKMRELYEKCLGRAIKGTEVHANEVWIDDTHDYRADYVVWNTNNEADAKYAQGIIDMVNTDAVDGKRRYLELNNELTQNVKVTHILEFKKNKIVKGSEIADIGLYLKRFEEDYGYLPEAVYIVARDINKTGREAIDMANTYIKRKSSPLIKFVPFTKFASKADLADYFDK